MPNILIKRIYDGIHPEDGFCVLVDRIWPRGISKKKLGDANWFKDIAPSAALRKEFKHDPDRWEEFKQRYFEDLDAQPELVEAFWDLISIHGIVTLFYSARDIQHNQAVALKEYLIEKQTKDS